VAIPKSEFSGVRRSTISSEAQIADPRRDDGSRCQNIRSACRRLVERIEQYPPSTVHEAQERSGASTSQIKPIYPGTRACGPAFTMSCHSGDNMMLITAISLAKPGDLLVVSACDHPEQGGFGEMLATARVATKLAGLVTDAGVRDGPAIRNTPAFISSLMGCA
jgi:4-hydroxy-4-methyl-2-oxoglutarate aldolase